ncbi:MAG: hypothetical protein FJW14_06845 [Acidimicrobiia bacterium]|nr:hypothetical protein [Acidimicrobiia bacterium]
MIGRLALRSLTAHPVRSAVLAAGFGVGVGVMAILLGVAEIVLQQSRDPALVGGGDVIARLSPQVPARLLLAGTLQSDALRSRVAVASPSHGASLYLMRGGRGSRVSARAGIPSLERALGDEETSAISAWRDAPEDVAWTQDSPDKVLRQIDRFHQIPPQTEWSASWAEWLYFNGRAANARFYLTFIVGPTLPDPSTSLGAGGRRGAGVRLQLERNGQIENFGEGAAITEEAVLRAPDLTIGASSVRLEGLRYRIHLDLPGERGGRVRGDLTIDASPGRLVPPLELTGARGWRSGYVVPVMSGALNGELTVDGERVSLANGTGYHDHNWGFWQGVSWQWGQVQADDLALLYGRVFPPENAADRDRIPGFLGVLGPDGPLAYATNVTITEEDDAAGQPKTIRIRARSSGVNLEVRFDATSAVTNRASGPLNASGLDFLQMRGTYTVTGRAADRDLNFSAAGSAETFRGR